MVKVGNGKQGGKGCEGKDVRACEGECKGKGERVCEGMQWQG